MPEASGVSGAGKFTQHLYASLPMSAEAGTLAHSIVDNTPGEHGLEAWRRLVQRFDPASAHGNLKLMSKTLKPPGGGLKTSRY